VQQQQEQEQQQLHAAMYAFIRPFTLQQQQVSRLHVVPAGCAACQPQVSWGCSSASTQL
jgi:hypothetical protein